MIYLIVCISIAFSVSIKPVQAQITGCCLETTSGDFCQQTTQPQCKTQFSPFTPCNVKSECSDYVCCEEDICQTNVLRQTCQSNNGIAHSDKTCSSVSECFQGCCIIGSQYSFTTQKQCNQLSNLFPSLPKEFRSEISTEQQCINLRYQETYGCCLSDLTYTIGAECSDQFYPNQFCSDVSDISEKHSYKDCSNNNIYWYDSLGNREDLAEECTNKLCETDPEPFCKDLSCTNTYSNEKFDYLGGTRNHGDAWCVYESPTGSFQDRPGSRHYRHTCINGEEIVEPCTDYRNQVCIQTTESNIQYAKCINNDNSSITQVPQGSDFWNLENNEDTCAQATFDCKIYYVKKHGLDDYDLYHSESAKCRTPEFIAQTAEYCKSLGDCGMDYNIENEFSQDGFFWTWTGTKLGGKPLQPDFTLTPTGINFNKVFIQATYINWSNYGIFNGIKQLSQVLTETIEESTETDLSAGKPRTLDWSMMVPGLVLGTFGAAAALQGTAVLFDLISQGLGAAFFGGPAAAIIALAIIALTAIFSATGAKKSKTIHFNCLPYQAPTENKCEKCTDQEILDKLDYNTCTQYRCKSLGADCQFDDSTGDPICYNENPYDITAATISPLFEHQDYTITQTTNSYQIAQEISPYQPIQIGIQTDKYTICAYSTGPNKQYNQMENYFGNPYRKKQHTIDISLPGDQIFNYYIKCETANGIQNPTDYRIQVRTSSEPDLTPPMIVTTSLIEYAQIKTELTETSFSLFTNEPSTCTWSQSRTNINNQMLCDSEININANQYECITVLPIQTGQNTYFFTCEDQNNNKLTTPYRHHLIGSEPLQILEKGPSGDLLYNDITLFVRTSAQASCEYSVKDFPFISFINTDSTQHSHPQTNLLKDNYQYQINCIDEAGNTATTQIEFEVTADTEPPKLLYTYKDQNNIYIILNEESSCKANNQQMSGTNSPLHSTEIQSYKYNIVCKDREENTISSIEVYP